MTYKQLLHCVFSPEQADAFADLPSICHTQQICIFNLGEFAQTGEFSQTVHDAVSSRAECSSQLSLFFCSMSPLLL